MQTTTCLATGGPSGLVEVTGMAFRVFHFLLPSFLSCHPTFPGDVLFQMAEVHRQIQNQLEEMVSPSPPTVGFWGGGQMPVGLWKARTV